MNNSIFKLMEEAQSKKLDPRLADYARANDLKIGEGDGEVSKDELIEKLAATEEFLYAQFTGETFDGTKVDVPHLNVREALNTSDVSIVFPRVISEVLQEPKEPNLFLTNQVADTVTLAANSPLSIEFPTVGALQAFDMAEGQEYAQQSLSFQQHMTSIRLKKIGVAAAVNEELINASMWPMIKLHMRLMSSAIDRRVEKTLFDAMTQRAQVVFDNDVTVLDNSLLNSDPTQFRTSGKAISGSTAVWNGSFSYFDLVKMIGVLLQNRYEATHFLAHPLMWPIFAQDPIMRAQFYHGGQMGAGIWTKLPEYDQSGNFPFGISYVPYYAIPFSENTTFVNAGGTGLGSSPVVSDLYCIDKSNSLFMAVRGGTEMDQMDNWFKDATMMKARKYVGVSVKDGGRGMVVARNIRVVPNEEPLFTIRQVSA